MVTASGLTVIDTNVFVIDLRYRRDRSFQTNERFLRRVAREGNGTTTVYNVLEVCGVLSFNLNVQQLRELYGYLPRRYSIEIAPTADLEASLPALTSEEVFDLIVRKMSFGDALIAAALDRHLPNATRFVSWDAEHFQGKLKIPAMTPAEFLREIRSRTAGRPRRPEPR